MIVEERVPLDRELAVLVARDLRGNLAVYPVVETVQIDGICRQVNLSRAHYRRQHRRRPASWRSRSRS